MRHKKPTIGFVGYGGRVASALERRLSDLGYRITGAKAGRSGHFATAHFVQAPEIARYQYPQCDVLLVAVPDDAIAHVAEEILADVSGIQGAVVHTSGSHSLDAFAPLAAQGVPIGSFHPMYPFRKDTRLTGDENMLVGIEASDTDLEQWLKRMALDMGGVPSLLKPGQKPAYHASAVIASNYLVTLFDIALKLMGDAGVERSVRKRALLDIMLSTLGNLSEVSPSEALTGPIARGDEGVIRVHLGVLNDYAKSYRELGLLTVDLAPDLNATQRELLRELLATIPD